MSFESSLKDQTVPIAIDFDTKQNVLLLAFGGLAHQLGFPMFEFNKSISALKNVNKIYLRDHHKLWYHRGMPHVGANIEGIAAFLQQYTMHPSTQRTIIFGTSGGGYAALLFGHILQADEVRAFSPKTFINPIRRIIHNDIPPGGQPQTLLWLLLHGQRKYFDLKKVFLAAPQKKRNFHIYYSANHKIDNLHAIRIRSIPGVHLHSYQHGQHNLIKGLKQSGKLSEIIERATRLVDCHHGLTVQQIHK